MSENASRKTAKNNSNSLSKCDPVRIAGREVFYPLPTFLAILRFSGIRKSEKAGKH